MKFTLLSEWKTILKKAWSIRLMALAAVFETAGMVLPVFVDDLPRLLFSALALITAGGGMWARLVEQKGFKQ